MSDKTEPKWVPAKDTRWEMRFFHEREEEMGVLKALAEGFEPFATSIVTDDAPYVYVYFRREMVRAVKL